MALLVSSDGGLDADVRLYNSCDGRTVLQDRARRPVRPLRKVEGRRGLGHAGRGITGQREAAREKVRQHRTGLGGGKQQPWRGACGEQSGEQVAIERTPGAMRTGVTSSDRWVIVCWKDVVACGRRQAAKSLLCREAEKWAVAAAAAAAAGLESRGEGYT